MPVQGEQRLLFFNEPSDCNAANVHIQHNMFIGLPIEGGAIQRRVVGWRVKQKNGSIELFFTYKGFKIAMDCPPLNSTLIHRDASATFFRRDGTGRNIPRYVVAFPVLEHKRSRRDTRIAVNREAAERKLLFMDVAPESSA